MIGNSIMPSGVYQNNKLGTCGICGRKLRPLYKQDDWDQRKYHVTCFKGILRDVANYNTVAYTKYGHTKRIAGLPEPVARKELTFTITFE